MVATTKTCCLHHEHERVEMRVHALVLICVLGVFCIPANARPQDANGGRPITPDSQVSGKVTAVHGKAATGAIVTLQNTQTGLKMTAKADKHGKYLFAKVVPGDYSLSASLKNKESDSQTISLDHLDKLQKDLKIKE
jgi:hypothetical protein